MLLTIRILLRMVSPRDWSYDADVPNKTIYVAEGDLPIYQRAQELAGGNLSAAITRALRRYVDIEEGRRDGYDEITVRLGPSAGRKGRKVRFSGVLLGEWANSSSSRFETYRVYRSRSGKFVLHVDRSAEWTAVDAEGKPAGWRGWVGLGNISYGSRPAESSLDVFDTIEALRDRIPPQLYEMVAGAANQPVVEDLDI
jgi:EXLDI family protein